MKDMPGYIIGCPVRSIMYGIIRSRVGTAMISSPLSFNLSWKMLSISSWFSICSKTCHSVMASKVLSSIVRMSSRSTAFCAFEEAAARASGSGSNPKVKGLEKFIKFFFQAS
ncbi:hypothetical protein COLO4_02529 [Corchorus olitorius]|uniref:Uncharacterized protein n=1 Tax=Corchorus olitorius TaxID=93759 RepID=A0A1R3L0T2_9ROSI|nr:hypothetical protein COLO4_02529 [Corchorus olitorius]